MLASLIRWSIQNRFLVLMGSLLLTAWGVHAMLSTPLDALPDLSDTQVIIRTEFPGQAPQVVEDQVTYPLTTTMLSVPGARTVRGYSFFGDSYVYIIFDDKTDLYWARSRVLEYLNQVTDRLPPSAKPTLGPDGTGVGRVRPGSDARPRYHDRQGQVEPARFQQRNRRVGIGNGRGRVRSACNRLS